MATLVGRQKIPPSIKDVDDILTTDLLDVASGVIEIVSKYLKNSHPFFDWKRGHGILSGVICCQNSTF